MSKYDSIDKELRPFSADLLQALNWYQAKALELYTEAFEEILDELKDYSISYHYHTGADGWYYDNTYSLTKLTAKEAIEILMNRQLGSDYNTWSFYVENIMGDPLYYLEFNGYEFYSDYILGDER